VIPPPGLRSLICRRCLSSAPRRTPCPSLRPPPLGGRRTPEDPFHHRPSCASRFPAPSHRAGSRAHPVEPASASLLHQLLRPSVRLQIRSRASRVSHQKFVCSTMSPLSIVNSAASTPLSLHSFFYFSHSISKNSPWLPATCDKPGRKFVNYLRASPITEQTYCD
jgi:hypothetical protein